MNELKITEYGHIRVLTTQQIAEAYETDARVISNNFNRNKERYAEGKHFICLDGEEKRDFINSHQFDDGSKKASKLYLWTEKGAFLHAKSLNTDKAWEVYDKLVDTYFKKTQPLSALEQISITQQAVLEVNEKVVELDNDLQNFKKDMPLLAVECETITKAKRKKIFDLTGGKNSNAYRDKSLRGKIYKDLESQLLREFGVGSYKAIKRSQTEQALDIIGRYELPLCLKEEVDMSNSQINLGV